MRKMIIKWMFVLLVGLSLYYGRNNMGNIVNLLLILTITVAYIEKGSEDGRRRVEGKKEMVREKMGKEEKRRLEKIGVSVVNRNNIFVLKVGERMFYFENEKELDGALDAIRETLAMQIFDTGIGIVTMGAN